MENVPENALKDEATKVAARIISDLPLARTSATESRDKLGWKLLSRGRAEHRAIFRFKRLNKLFPHSFNVVLAREHLDYNTRSKDNVKLFQIETGGSLDFDKFCFERMEQSR